MERFTQGIRDCNSMSSSSILAIPDERIQSVIEFKEALLGDWNPSQNPKAALPAPSLKDFVKASEEQIFAWVAMLLLVVSVVTTLMK